MTVVPEEPRPYVWLLANWGLSLASTCNLIDSDAGDAASLDPTEAGRSAADCSGDS